MIYTVTARLHKLILAVHSICKKKRIFHNFYLRLKSADAFTMNNALLSSNSTNSLLKSVRKTSAFKFQPHWMIFSHEVERIYSFHNANPQFFKITSRHNKSPISGFSLLFFKHIKSPSVNVCPVTLFSASSVAIVWKETNHSLKFCFAYWDQLTSITAFKTKLVQYARRKYYQYLTLAICSSVQN